MCAYGWIYSVGYKYEGGASISLKREERAEKSFGLSPSIPRSAFSPQFQLSLSSSSTASTRRQSYK